MLAYIRNPSALCIMMAWFTVNHWKLGLFKNLIKLTANSNYKASNEDNSNTLHYCGKHVNH